MESLATTEGITTATVATPASADARHRSPAGQHAHELRVLRVLVESTGRVVSRTELIRRAGLRGVAPRRIDVLLVEIRRIVGECNLVNVRGRGWMLMEVPPHARVLAAEAETAAA